MPVITRFYGMVIKMYFQQAEHNPPDLPAKALSLVREWAKEHQKELLEIWATQQFRKLPPLE